ncbi:MAG: DinB family protein [Phycisphaeraceae bacterium]|nr:DinB family protein [Phycisphaeraceae bacterium]
MRSQEFVASSVRHSKDLLKRYLVKFDDSNHTRTAPGCPNHLAWCLGHLALTASRFAEWLPRGNQNGGALPVSDFIVDAKSGDENRFGTESICFGSDPNSPGVVFPTFARCVQIFEAATERLAAGVEQLSDAELVAPVPMFGGKMTPPYLLAARAIYHVGIHNGQIAYLRREIGLGSALG